MGSLGLDCLANVERMRSRSKNLQGGISGKMRRDLERAREVINTLIYKAEALGDPAFLRIKNKELLAQIEKSKLDEILRNREMEEMRGMIQDLKKEVSELRDKLDDAEEDRRKARESLRITEWKMRKQGTEGSEKESDVRDFKKSGEEGQANIEINMIDLPVAGTSHDEILTDVVRPNSPMRGSGAVLEDEPVKKRKEVLTTEEESIQRQIKELFRRRTEVRKRRRMEDSEMESENRQSREIPLPKREPRIRPRILSDVQIAPPRMDREGSNKDKERKEIPTNEENLGARSTDKEEWTRVFGKKESKYPRNKDRQEQHQTQQQLGLMNRNKYNISNKKVNKIRRPPKTAAVMVTSKKEDFTYADVLKLARGKISLDELDIPATKIRKAANSGMIIEVLGPNSFSRANTLAEKLKGVFLEQARVVRPTVKGEIRLVGLDDSVTVEEVICVIAQNGECNQDEVKVGTIRPMINGLHTVWIQCPLAAAIRVANQKKIKIGWTLARVDLLEARPVQCFKCWKFGHVRLACTTKDDYSGLCFRCGGAGHLARNCNLSPSCKLYVAEGKDPNHRLGSNLCTAEHKVDKSRTNFATTDRSGPNLIQRDTQMDTNAH